MKADILRIAGYWLEHDAEKVPQVITAIRQRVNWITDGRQLRGSAVAGLSPNYRWYLERTYGYKIYYRTEGAPPETLSMITDHPPPRPRASLERVDAAEVREVASSV